MKGKLIVIDGSDGTGKGTQTELLIQRLKDKNIGVVKFDFPQYDDFFGKAIAKYLNNDFGPATELNPYLVSMIYVADRWKASIKLKEALQKGKVIIINRYMPSSMAHQGSKLDGEERTVYLKWLNELEYEQFAIPKPDAVIVLSMPASVSQDLVDKKSKRDYTEMKRDGHESDKDYLAKTNAFYRELAKEQDGWHLIDCIENNELMSKEKINDLIWEKVIYLLEFQ